MSAHLTDDQLELAAKGGTFDHLASCASCTQRVDDAKGRLKLMGGLVPYTLSDMAFRRVEARLMSQVEQGLSASPSWWARAWWLLPVSALAALSAWVVTSNSASVDGSVHTIAVKPVMPRPAAFALAAAHFEPLTVLRASSDARVRHGTEPWRALKVGAVIGRGDAVFGTSVAMAPANEVAWSFELSGAAAVANDSSLSLGSGELSAHVSGTGTDIVVGSLHVLASEATFSLNRAAAEVLVDVAQGRVEVFDTGSAERRQVNAPVALRWADGSNLASAPPVASQKIDVRAVPARPWVLFDASTLPSGAVVSLDGVRVDNEAQLVSSGKHRLSIAAAGEPAKESWVELTQAFVAVMPVAKRDAALEPDAKALARIQDELKRQRPRLSACYEKWLKANPSAVDADIELHLVVGATGHVNKASVEGAAISASSAECLIQTAKALTLPGLGAEVELALPLHLTTSH